MLGCKTVTAPSGSCTREPHGWGHGAEEEGNETSLTLSLSGFIGCSSAGADGQGSVI